MSIIVYQLNDLDGYSIGCMESEADPEIVSTLWSDYYISDHEDRMEALAAHLIELGWASERISIEEINP